MSDAMTFGVPFIFVLGGKKDGDKRLRETGGDECRLWYKGRYW